MNALIESHQKFLIDHLATNRTRHSGRTLYDHLKGTYDLLNAWGNPPGVCLGGLFHSIYGTNRFHFQSLQPWERPRLRELIGERAERLAWIFCTVNRPSVWFSEPDFDDLKDGDLADLIEIEAANLIEQGSRSRWLRHILTCDTISDGCRAAILRHLEFNGGSARTTSRARPSASDVPGTGTFRGELGRGLVPGAALIPDPHGATPVRLVHHPVRRLAGAAARALPGPRPQTATPALPDRRSSEPE